MHLELPNDRAFAIFDSAFHLYCIFLYVTLKEMYKEWICSNNRGKKLNGNHKLFELPYKIRRNVSRTCICPRSAINRNYPWSVEYYLIEIHSLTSLYLFYYVGTACLFKKQLRAPIELIKHLFKIGNRVLFVIIYIRPFH